MPKHNEGISGAKGRDKRPGFDRLHKAITRREFDVVAAWSIDRLGLQIPTKSPADSEMMSPGDTR